MTAWARHEARIAAVARRRARGAAYAPQIHGSRSPITSSTSDG